MTARYVMGNWKMNGSVNRLQTFADAWHDLCVERGQPSGVVGLCVPFPYLARSRELLPEVVTGAQDCSAQDEGAYTGEVSAAMLADMACAYVIVGHSERRRYHGESDALIAAKAKQAQQQGVVPIVCVGETLEERRGGRAVDVVTAQITAIVGELDATTLLIAYEPVWAIGTGISASAEEAQAMHAVIRALMIEALGPVGGDVPLLYGGSVTPSIAGELFAEPDIDGALVGGASLEAASLYELAEIAAGH